MKLLEFYKDVLTSAGLLVDEEGNIKLKVNADSTINIMANGKPLVLPTKNQINSMTEVVDGKVLTTKVLFNPLKEDMVKGESEGLKRLIKIYDARLAELYYTLVDLLLILGADKELQKKASLKVMTIMGNLKDAKTQNVTNVIDDGTVERWAKISAASLKAPATKGALHLYSKKAGKIDNVVYNRIAVLTSPLKKIIDKLDNKEPLLGVKVRRKDVNVFRIMYETLMPNINDNTNDYLFGSNDEDSPGFISVCKMYSTVGGRLLDLINELKFIDDDIGTKFNYEIKDLTEMLDNIQMFKQDVKFIPSDADNNRNKITAVIENSVVETPVATRTSVKDILNNNTAIATAMNSNTRLPIVKQTAPVEPIYQTAAVPVQQVAQQVPVQQVVQQVPQQVMTQQQVPVQQTVQQVPADNIMTPAQKILYGNTQVQQQQMPVQQMMPQQQMLNQQMMPQMQMPKARPRGINSMVGQQQQMQMMPQQQMQQQMMPQMQMQMPYNM